MKRTIGCALILGAVVLGGAAPAEAAPILSAVSATIQAGGPGDGFIKNTHDQAGLIGTYTSGVTDFDTFLGTNPLHTSTYYGFEWFSTLNQTTAQVTYDLGSAHYIDRLALWNEESSGIGVLDLFYSLDGTNFFALALGLTPQDNVAIGYDVNGGGRAHTQLRSRGLCLRGHERALHPVRHVELRATERRLQRVRHR